MSSITAAYCAACRAFVFVSIDGDCENGHPRANLRGLYSAQVDKRTGRPIPPSMDQRSTMSRPVAPVAPSAEMGMTPSAQAQAAMLSAISGPQSEAARARLPRVSDVREAFDQLFGPPRGRHSARRGY